MRWMRALRAQAALILLAAITGNSDTAANKIEGFAGTEEWKSLGVDAWQAWLVPMYVSAVINTAKMNRENLDSCSVRTAAATNVSATSTRRSEPENHAARAQRLVQELVAIPEDNVRSGDNLKMLEDLVEEIRKAKSMGRGHSMIPPSLDASFDFPVYIMNLPERPDKRRHMSCLAASLGFTNVTFPNVTRGEELNLAEEISKHKVIKDIIPTLMQSNAQDIHRVGETTAMAYVANALSQLDVIRHSYEAGHAFFGIFEDDLVMSGSAEATRKTIRQAIQELPDTADMLYLEACYEQCDASTFSSSRPHVMKLQCPSCSAAIIYTAKGAKRVLDSCVPAFHGIDVMFPKLIETGQLEAYLALPQPFFQDAFWGSDARDGHGARRERASAPEAEAEEAAARRGTSDAGRRIRRGGLGWPGIGAMAPFKAGGGEEAGGRGREGRGQAEAGRAERLHRIFTPTCYESMGWVLDDTELSDVALMQGEEEEEERGTVRVVELSREQSRQGWSVEGGGAVVYYTQSWDDMNDHTGKYSVEVAVWRNTTARVQLRLPRASSCFETNVGVCKLEMVLEDAEGGELASLQRDVVLDWGEARAESDWDRDWEQRLGGLLGA